MSTTWAGGIVTMLAGLAPAAALLAVLDVGSHATAAGQSQPLSGRLAGIDRIGTAIAISEHQFPNGSQEAYLANAEKSSDAVAGGVLTGGPILLVPECGPLPPAVAAELERLAPERIFALGGSAAVSESMLQQASTGVSAPRAGCVPAGVTLVATEAPDGRSATIVLRNGSESAVETTPAYSLSLQEGRLLVPLEPPVGPFTAPLVILEAGQATEPQQVGPQVPRDGQLEELQVGTYQVCRSVNRSPICTTFAIRS